MNAIHLPPIGNTESGIVRELIYPLQKIFHADVVLVQADVPMQAFYDVQRGQYDSTSLILHLRGMYAAHSTHGITYLAVTAEDLFIPILTYVFGEAELGGGVAVASYYRLQNERYGLPPNRPLLVRRLIKEAAHELGHAIGLVHCSSQSCVMHSSTNVEEIDLKGEKFCIDCTRLVEQKGFVFSKNTSAR
ncbi:MAG: hypothetical protein C4326_15325 [Ignavibacteria bacterium]